MKNTNLWGICCPGPSLALYKTQKRISMDNPGSLVAVNGAILLADFNFDYWAIQDIEVFEDMINKMDISKFYTTRLWVPRRWLKDIPEHYDKLNYYFQAFYKETFPAESMEAVNEIIPFGHHINWRESTFFMAIALAIISGASQINVYGADMEGKGYFINGLENYRIRHDEKRWSNERHWFQYIIDECKSRGITINREQE
jgi:hypothetical protein